MKLPKDWREFIELLNSNQVEYLIIGAFAVAYHGYPRYTGDLDFLIRPTNENARRVMKALHEFGFGSVEIEEADFLAEGQIIQLGVAPQRIDLATSISGVSSEEAWASRIPDTLDGLSVNFLGRETLIENKRASGRAKDLADLQQLLPEEDPS